MSAGETLTIRDRDMVAAIAAVRRRLPEPRRQRRRLPLAPILGIAALAAAAAWGPRMIRAATVRLIPPEQAAEIGDRMLIALIEAHGPPCDDPEGERALGALAAALEPDAPPRLRVMDLGRTPAVAALPGGTVLIDRATATTATPRSSPGGWRRRSRPIRSGRWSQTPASWPASATSSAATSTSATLARAAESAVAAPAAAPPAEAPGYSRNPTGRPSAAFAVSRLIGTLPCVRAFQRCIRRMKLVKCASRTGECFRKRARKVAKL